MSDKPENSEHADSEAVKCSDLLSVCPECGDEIYIEFDPAYRTHPYERVCKDCGWYDLTRYRSIGEAENGKNR